MPEGLKRRSLSHRFASCVASSERAIRLICGKGGLVSWKCSNAGGDDKKTITAEFSHYTF